MDLQEVGWTMDWTDLAQNRDRWVGCCERGNEHSGSIKWGVFLDYLKSGYLLKMDLAPWSK